MMKSHLSRFFNIWHNFFPSSSAALAISAFSLKWHENALFLTFFSRKSAFSCQNLSFGCKLARTYLYILHDATFYRQWAEDVLPLTRSVKLLDAHPLYGPLSHSFPEKDVMY